MLKVTVPCDFCDGKAEITTKSFHFSVQSEMPKGWKLVYMLPACNEELQELDLALLACPKCAKEIGDVINQMMAPRSVAVEVEDSTQ